MGNLVNRRSSYVVMLIELICQQLSNHKADILEYKQLENRKFYRRYKDNMLWELYREGPNSLVETGGKIINYCGKNCFNNCWSMSKDKICILQIVENYWWQWDETKAIKSLTKEIMEWNSMRIY